MTYWLNIYNSLINIIYYMFFYVLINHATYSLQQNSLKPDSIYTIMALVRKSSGAPNSANSRLTSQYTGAMQQLQHISAVIRYLYHIIFLAGLWYAGLKYYIDYSQNHKVHNLHFLCVLNNRKRTMSLLHFVLHL